MWWLESALRSWKKWPDPVLVDANIYPASIQRSRPYHSLCPAPPFRFFFSVSFFLFFFFFFSFFFLFLLKGSSSPVFWGLEDKDELNFWKTMQKTMCHPVTSSKPALPEFPYTSFEKSWGEGERVVRLAENVEQHETWVISMKLSFSSAVQNPVNLYVRYGS